ncbi:MAG TPA: hypothetical protein VMW27_04755 [Thermoanaerobaculia bacterium]|nr:hypothetical protein [Thermoanaerobaculia bacterium]
MSRNILAGLCLSGSLLLAGCFDVEQAMTLNKDLSGTATFDMKMDMAPMALIGLYMQRSMEGKEGPPSSAEIEAAKKDLLASMKKEEVKVDPKAKEADVKKTLPDGVKLLESSFTEKELEIGTHLVFGFDHISKLGLIDLPDDKKQQAGPGPGQGPGGASPFDQPFAGLKLVDEGSTLLLTSRTVNPLQGKEEQEAEMDIDAATKKQVEDMMKGLRIAFKINAPFEVVEHNATRKEGKTLVWEWTYATLDKMTPEQAAEGIRVRFKK